LAKSIILSSDCPHVGRSVGASVGGSARELILLYAPGGLVGDLAGGSVGGLVGESVGLGLLQRPPLVPNNPPLPQGMPPGHLVFKYCEPPKKRSQTIPAAQVVYCPGAAVPVHLQ